MGESWNLKEDAEVEPPPKSKSLNLDSESLADSRKALKAPRTAEVRLLINLQSISVPSMVAQNPSLFYYSHIPSCLVFSVLLCLTACGSGPLSKADNTKGPALCGALPTTQLFGCCNCSVFDSASIEFFCLCWAWAR